MHGIGQGAVGGRDRAVAARVRNMTRKTWKTGVVVLLMGIIVTTLAGCPSDVVIFKDPNLEGVVKETLGIPLNVLVRRGDLLALLELDATALGIESLKGLEAAANLQVLLASGNGIADLTPLQNLVNLRVLDLSENEVLKVITPLIGLRNLDHVLLYGNNIFDASPLVANAVVGGLGPGDTVELDERTFVDEDDNVNPDVATLIDDYGVTVVLVTGT